LAKTNDIFLMAISHSKTSEANIEKLKELTPNILIKKVNIFEIYLRMAFSFLFSIKPFQTAYFYNKKIKKEFDIAVENFKPDVIYAQLIRTAEYIKTKDNFFRVLDFQDAFSIGMKRRAEKSKGLIKFFFNLEYKRLKNYEAKLFDFINAFTIISNTDRMLIDSNRKNEIEIIENGVDFDFYKPIEKEKKYDLVLTGNMSYPPNINSAEFLVNKILPDLLKIKPNLKVLIAGASPHSKVKKLASKNVTISGWLEDIRDAYSESKVFIAPMQIGTGLQNKLLEAMAMKIPSITSELANNALKAKEHTEILVGSSVDEYVKHIIKLLEDKKYANELAENAFKFVKQNYSWESSVNKLEQIFKAGLNEK